MIIFGELCEWTAPGPRKMTSDEVRHLARELARCIGRIVIAGVSPGIWEIIESADRGRTRSHARRRRPPRPLHDINGASPPAACCLGFTKRAEERRGQDDIDPASTHARVRMEALGRPSDPRCPNAPFTSSRSCRSPAPRHGPRRGSRSPNHPSPVPANVPSPRPLLPPAPRSPPNAPTKRSANPDRRSQQPRGAASTAPRPRTARGGQATTAAPGTRAARGGWPTTAATIAPARRSAVSPRCFARRCIASRSTAPRPRPDTAHTPPGRRPPWRRLLTMARATARRVPIVPVP